MKTLLNLNVPKDTAAKFPFGTIQNETDTQQGTPVVRELYGDIITNLYKLLEVTKEDPTGDEDSNDTQYQIIAALRKLTNTLNDVEQVLTLNGTVWNVGLDLELLPNKYVFIARSAENYNSAESYTFKGSGAATIAASSSTGFSVNDEVLIIVDSTGVRMYSLTKLTEAANTEAFAVLGAPISYNDSADMAYLESGKIYTNDPKIFNIEETIQNTLADGALILSDAIIKNGFILAMVYDPGAIDYRLHALPSADPTSSDEVNYSGFAIAAGVDNQPYIFADNDFIYITNNFNASANDLLVSKYTYNAGTNTLTFVGNINMAGSFGKTTNVVAINNRVYTFVNGIVNSYDRDTGAEQNELIDFTLFNGVIFNFNGSFYYTKDEVAAKWNF